MAPILCTPTSQLSSESNAAQTLHLLQRCSNMEELRQIHGQMLKTGLILDEIPASKLLAFCASPNSGSLAYARTVDQRDTVSWNSMIDGYTKCGEIEMAYEIFNHMPERNIISWTSMISGCVGAGKPKEALNLFHRMQTAGIKLDNVALVSTLQACADLGVLDQGKWIHAYIKKHEIEIDPILGCVLIDMYAKCGDLEEAIEVFRKMEEKGVSVWTAMISGYAIHGRGREALEWFMKMQTAGVEPNQMTFTGF
ncbi:Pentatricopeptide repeat-containing protein [Vitis vinifera]|uniref:Pentatricopeptide repeat-containing protein n=1 Tax=Vitis vinifera TaxID=29760 RepID=A0A438JR64_VITVI|nr:Pentatricopeptide repeat-containing protein [Vitis vinifera]